MNSKEARQVFNEAFPHYNDDSLGQAERPLCPCGWSGKGTGPNGKILRGDRCPQCGESVY